MGNSVNLNSSLFVSVYDGSFESFENENLNNQTANQSIQSKPNQQPRIPRSVSITVRKGETPETAVYRALMQAARQAGLPPGEQKKFADAFSKTGLNWEQGDPNPQDGKQVKASDYNNKAGTILRINLSNALISDLQNRRQEYLARGGKLYSNREIPSQNPSEQIAAKNGIEQNRQVGSPNGVTGVSPNSIKTRFSVLLNNDGRPVPNERILAQFAEDRYKGGNLWGENFHEIAALSILQGVKISNIENKGGVGNKIRINFEISPQDQLKIHQNYITVQEQVNAVEEIVNQTRDKMALNQFLKGVFEGAWESLKANWHLVTNPLETLQGIVEAVKTLASLSSEDLSKIVEHLKQSGHDLIFKDDISEVSNKAGKLVGAIAVEIALGKGLGLALRGLKGIKAVESLVNKADDLAKLSKIKLLEAFSDNAAKLASQKAKARLRQLDSQLNAGFPIPPDLLQNFAVVAGNKLLNGSTKFADFAKKMVDEFGEKVKPYIEKLYREKMIELGQTEKIDEIGIKSTNIKKLSQAGLYTEKIKWGIQEVEVRPDGKGFWGKRTPQNNPRVDAFERKVNSNNESYYISHPNGGYVQFENLSQTALQDGKLIMQPQNSIYRVYDKPAFLRKKILDEAIRQVGAAAHNGLKVEWLVSDKETINQLTRFFKENKIDIKVIYLPE